MKKMLALIDDNEIMLVESTERGLCFNYVEIAKADDTIRNYDYMYDRYEGLVDCLGKDDIINLCDNYDCAPFRLVDALTEDAMEDEEIAMDELDCSLYPEIMKVNNTDYIFISNGCGSIDYFVKKLNMTADDELYKQILEYEKLEYGNKEVLREIERKLNWLDDQETLEKFVNLIEEKEEEEDYERQKSINGSTK